MNVSSRSWLWPKAHVSLSHATLRAALEIVCWTQQLKDMQKHATPFLPSSLPRSSKSTNRLAHSEPSHDSNHFSLPRLFQGVSFLAPPHHFRGTSETFKPHRGWGADAELPRGHYPRSALDLGQELHRAELRRWREGQRYLLCGSMRRAACQ